MLKNGMDDLQILDSGEILLTHKSTQYLAIPMNWTKSKLYVCRYGKSVKIYKTWEVMMREEGSIVPENGLCVPLAIITESSFWSYNPYKRNQIIDLVCGSSSDGFPRPGNGSLNPQKKNIIFTVPPKRTSNMRAYTGTWKVDDVEINNAYQKSAAKQTIKDATDAKMLYQIVMQGKSHLKIPRKKRACCKNATF